VNFLKKRHSIEVVFVLTIICITSIWSVAAQPYWLEEDSYMEHEFSGKMKTYGSIQRIYFQGTIRWECLDITDDFATIEETLSFTIPQTYYGVDGVEHLNEIVFFGKEYYDMANVEDYTFITEFPMDDKIAVELFEPVELLDPGTGEVVIDEDTGLPVMMGDYVVVITNVTAMIEKNVTVKVDLDTRDVYDMEGNLFGRWLWWLNVDEYPLDGKVTELALYNWRGYEVPVGIRYWNMDMEEIKQLWDMAFQYWVPEGVYDWFLMSNYDVPGYEGYDENNERSIQPIIFRDLYDANTGYLIYSEHWGLADDISLNIFGLEAHLEYVKFSDTNIDFSTPPETTIHEETNNTKYYIAFVLLMIIFIILIGMVMRNKSFD